MKRELGDDFDLTWNVVYTSDPAKGLGRYFSNGAQFWLDLQSQYDIAVVEREHGSEIAKRVRPADAAGLGDRRDCITRW